MSDLTPEEATKLLRQQGQQAVRRNRAARRKFKKEGRLDNRTASGIIIPDPEPSPEHYHLLYGIPKDGVLVPNWERVFVEHKEAREAMAEIGRKGEPNVEWYEDGRVGVEMRDPNRTGLFWVILEIAACVRSSCAPTVRREHLKRALIVLPGRKKR